MALRPQDTHKAEYPASGVIRQPYLPYLSSNLQDMGISDKILKLVKKTTQLLLVWLGKLH